MPNKKISQVIRSGERALQVSLSPISALGVFSHNLIVLQCELLCRLVETKFSDLEYAYDHRCKTISQHVGCDGDGYRFQRKRVDLAVSRDRSITLTLCKGL